MASQNLEKRVAALESEMSHLKVAIEIQQKNKEHWIDLIYGAFKGEPLYAEAMRLGRKYRDSTKPKPKKSSKS